MVGRVRVDLGVDKAPRRCPARRPSRSATSPSSTTAGVRQLDDISLRRRPRRDRRRSPASRATARPSSPRPCSGCRRRVAGSITLDGDELVGRSRQGRARRRRRLRPRGPLDRRRDRATSPSPRTSSSTCTDNEPVRPGRRAEPGRGARTTPRSGSRSSTSAPARSTRTASTLSGGNQQKVVLAREMSRPLRLLIASPAHPRPRRRLDRVRAQADRGGARQRHPRDHRLHRAGRGARARRPDPVMYRGRIVGDVPGRHRPRRAGPDDGRRPAGGRRAAGRRAPHDARRGRPRGRRRPQPSRRPATTAERRRPRRSCEQPDAGPAAGRAGPAARADRRRRADGASPTAVAASCTRCCRAAGSCRCWRSCWPWSSAACSSPAADAEVQAAASYFFSRPGDLHLRGVDGASRGLRGAVPGRDLRPAGRDVAGRSAPLTETLTVATP